MKKEYSFLIRPLIAVILVASIGFSFIMLYGYNKLAKELFVQQHGVRLTGAMQTMTEDAYSSFIEGAIDNNKTKLDNSVETTRATIGIANGEDFRRYETLNKSKDKLREMSEIAEKYEYDGNATRLTNDRYKMATLKKEASALLEEFENDEWEKITYRHAKLIEKLDTLNMTILAINLTLTLLVIALWNMDRQKERARGELVELNKNLENIIAQKTEKIKAANESKSIFLSNMAHDIKTPLNSIIGFASLLAHDESIDEKKKRQAQSILDSGYYILDIASDMTDIARIESGKIKLYSEKFYIEELKTNLSVIFAPLAAQKNITFEILCSIKNNISVFGDKQKITRILSNLLSNAINFTDNNGIVTLSITRQSGNNFAFEVKDNGRGISAENMEKIFEPFFQVDGKQNIGNGLGLFIVKNYIEAMNSKLTLESKEGAWSRFAFVLNLESASESVPYQSIQIDRESSYKEEPDIDPQNKDAILQYARQGRVALLKESIANIQSDILRGKLMEFAESFDMDGLIGELERFEREKEQ